MKTENDQEGGIRVSKQRSPSSSGANLNAFSIKPLFAVFSIITASPPEEEEAEDPLEDIESGATLFLIIICAQKVSNKLNNEFMISITKRFLVRLGESERKRSLKLEKLL